ncbi:MAG: hypothetical protein C4567_14235 [Deltaproteobacteria bacterium]|nr:MAG: hypothetical protein C4567_14235 [Deltaproteobacteria bacterium]
MPLTNYREGIRVIPVQSEEDLWEFLRLPWRIYPHDPYWVPPILSHQRDFLDPRKGPFFEVGEAQYFLALYQGQPAGRISAHCNRLYDAFYDRITGFFGFFECIPNLQVAAALFAAAADWLRQRGRTRLLGPLSFSIYDEVGLLVEGFDSIPAMFQAHNPPYYPEFLGELGFRKTFDFYALRLTQRFDLEPLEKKIEEILQGQNLTLAPYNPRDLERRREEVYELFNEAWSSNWGHIPLTRKQFQLFYDELKPLLRPNLVKLLLDGDSLVAFSIVLPDLNPLVRTFNGELSWWKKLRLYYEAKYKPIKKVRALVLGVRQPYQGRKLHQALILKSYVDGARETPCEFVDLSLIPENLRHYLRAFRVVGAERYKVFRIFEKEF